MDVQLLDDLTLDACNAVDEAWTQGIAAGNSLPALEKLCDAITLLNRACAVIRDSI